MRLTVTVTVVAVAVLAGSAAAQLNVGPQGLSAPPINLLSVFRFLRNAFNHIMFSGPSEAEEKEGTDTVMHALEDGARKCLGEDHPCWPWLLDDNGEADNGVADNGEANNGEAVDGEAVDAEGGNGENGEEEQTTFDVAESKYVVTKWIMAYVAIIIATSVSTLVIGYPYLITGQTFRSLHSGLLPLPDHQDSMLLLTWLLGEASGDESCLERVVCLNPERSARYLAVPNIVTSFFSRWVPIHYLEQLGRLGDVTQNGLNQSCEQYSCPVLPNL